MEEKNMRELNMDELDKVSGGALTQKKMDYVTKLMKSHKKEGYTLEEVLSYYGNNPEYAEFIRFIWNLI